MYKNKFVAVVFTTLELSKTHLVQYFEFMLEQKIAAGSSQIIFFIVTSPKRHGISNHRRLDCLFSSFSGLTVASPYEGPVLKRFHAIISSCHEHKEPGHQQLWYWPNQHKIFHWGGRIYRPVKRQSIKGDGFVSPSNGSTLAQVMAVCLTAPSHYTEPVIRNFDESCGDFSSARLHTICSSPSLPSEKRMWFQLVTI